MPDLYRALICGSRDYTDRRAVWLYLSELSARHDHNLIVVHGDCPTGADKFADQWCAFYRREPERHPAEWQRYAKPGRRNPAGPIRNEEMAQAGADVCVAFHRLGLRRFKETGTCNMVCNAVDCGIPVRVVTKGGEKC